MPHVELSLIDSRRLPPGTDQVRHGSPPQSDAGQADQAGGQADQAGRADAAAARSARVPRTRAPAEDHTLLRWAAVVTAASEPTVVIGADSHVVAASPACAELLACGDPADMRGRCLRQSLRHLVDFTEPPVPLDATEVEKIPPLLALASGRLARGLIRVAPAGEERPRTLDAVSAPLHEDGAVAGSVTFFAKI